MAAMKKAVAKKAAAMLIKKDMVQDAKMMRGMKPAQKSAFKKADKKMDAKKPTAKADMRMDMALRKRLMAKKGK
jgi:hypothetical protein